MKIFLFIFSIIFISIKTQQRIFRFPFKKKESNDKDIIKSVLENKIYTEINIGTPPQKIPVQINLDIFSFYLADPTIKGDFPKFNSTKSSSYSYSQRITFFNIQPFRSGYHSKDYLYFNNTKLSDFLFILADQLYNNNSGVLGFAPMCLHEKRVNDTNILDQLKKKNLVKSYVFTVNYTSENEGEIIVGDYPSEYNIYYMKEDFLYIKAEMRSYEFHWDLSFDGIYFNNVTSITYTYYAEFNIDLDIIIGSKKFRNELNIAFFDKKIENKECFYNLIYYKYSNLYYFYCNLDTNISNFSDIEFRRKDWGESVIFTSKELFKKVGNHLYFIIFFEESSVFYRWKLGRIFFQKLKTVVFDKERKIIGRYTMETDPLIKIREEEAKKRKKRNIWIILICLIIICLFLALYANKLFSKFIRKKRINELIDDYDYSPVT